jgi:ferrous iron transport protein B
MELPNYRMPSFKSVILLMWEKAKDFLTRAFTIIFIATIVVWFLQTFDMRFNMVDNQQTSLLATAGKFIAPIFKFTGFGFWQAAVALITGFMAKESVISTLAVLSGTSVDALPTVLTGMFNPVSAFSFLVFTLLYTPCVAAIATIKREFNNGILAFVIVVGQCVVAWLWAVAFYQVGSWIF